ncbi:MAG: hypothetical protein IPF73_06540 [Betaproteobacteria bacterium]|nr:hypothetical protein [Betaproteobacteria bacterium]
MKPRRQAASRFGQRIGDAATSSSRTSLKRRTWLRSHRSSCPRERRFGSIP